jgi:hypothetical protein
MASTWTFGAFDVKIYFFVTRNWRVDVAVWELLPLLPIASQKNLTLRSEAFLSVDGDRNGRIEKEEIKAMLQR